MIYQYINRTATHEKQIKIISENLKSFIPEQNAVFAVRFSPYSPRACFILARADETPIINQRLHDYLSGLCGKFWDSYLRL